MPVTKPGRVKSLSKTPVPSEKTWLSGIVLSLVGLIALVSWLLFGRLALFHTTEHPLTYQAKPLRIAAGVKVGQSLVAHYPGLYRIDVLLTTFGRRRVSDLVFHLQADGPEGEELFSTAVDGATIVDNAFQSFIFPPLDDSAGRSYFFYLESPGADPDEAAGVRLSVGDRDSEGRLYITHPKKRPGDEKAAPPADFPNKVFLPFVAAAPEPEGWRPLQDMGFMVYYKGRPLETLAVFLDRLAANKPLFWGEVWFYLLLFVLYLVLLAWLARVLRRIVRAQNSK
jgi:hypothetical protein